MEVLIVEDHPLYCDGLVSIVRQLNEHTRVAIADSKAEAVKCYRDLDEPALVLLDLSLPDASGLVALSELRRTDPVAPVAVFTDQINPTIVSNCLQRGAQAVVAKSYSPGVVGGILRLILAGGIYVPPEVLGGDLTAASIASPHPVQVPRLTPRQKEVLQLLAQGFSNKAIAAELGLTEGTVKIHVTTIFKALGVRNRTEAAAAAQHVWH